MTNNTQQVKGNDNNVAERDIFKIDTVYINPSRLDTNENNNKNRFSEICNFDLNDIMPFCIATISKNQGLIGFVTDQDSPRFLNYFTKRLVNDWGSEKFYQDPIIPAKIDNLHNDISIVIKDFEKTVQNINHDIIYKVEIISEDLMKEFWENIRIINTRNHIIVLIVLLATSKVSSAHEKLFPLKRVCVEKNEIIYWTRQICRLIKCSEDTIQLKINEIENECKCKSINDYHIELIYSFFENIIREADLLL